MLRVHSKLIYLVALELFLADHKIIISVEVSLAEAHIPDADVSSGVAHEKSTMPIEDEAVRVYVVEHRRLLRCR